LEFAFVCSLLVWGLRGHGGTFLLEKSNSLRSDIFFPPEKYPRTL